jgi:hypothetical protein
MEMALTDCLLISLLGDAAEGDEDAIRDNSFLMEGVSAGRRPPFPEGISRPWFI